MFHVHIQICVTPFTFDPVCHPVAGLLLPLSHRQSKVYSELCASMVIVAASSPSPPYCDPTNCPSNTKSSSGTRTPRLLVHKQRVTCHPNLPIGLCEKRT
ncbi:hypothetical protein PVAP13_6KG218606 [Panicum virgatum]|uniref:Uncharacterized protein n=1 Tax=Panicum virgatum TaxID=38727 RepID=A0A8T0RC74_PANVG|nr:hypothetical protein PVAP13_6KG218606 [Panicum virgatum]